jgi:hypothetical protein
MRSLSNANGRDVAKASHDNMIASATSNYTRIIDHSYAMAAESRLRDLTPLIVIVRFSTKHSSGCPLIIYY